MSVRSALLGSLLCVACGPTIGVASEGSDSGPVATTDAPPSEDASATAAVSTSSTSSTSSTTEPAEDSDSDADSDDPPPVIWDCASPPTPETFHHCIGVTDSPSPGCSLVSQNCGGGEKCNPLGGGGDPWSESNCVPVAPDPGGAGEPCTISGDPYSGEDDCDLGLFCVPDDDASNDGVCWSMCTLGPGGEVMCSEGECAWLYGELIPVCVEACDPVLQDCAMGRCDSGGEPFGCMPSVGPGLSPGTPCNFIGQCEPGATCFDAARVPGCAGSGCCANFCDVLGADPDADCGGVGACTPWFEGMAPAGLEHVGGCVG